ncbi:glycosyltransferase family 2 protein [Methylobacter marinus]|jgi:glycosyltransferase involved in cell wall biosynthesis|uniref:glycosyltransferase family 2 protein n=1 Tax=Methylobacter marinus TaxID=34058 RepID=UPI00036F15CB|nr:glycosyltransferase family 2 protein [Methylobacter marinus]
MMDARPLISVVMPCFNAEKHLAASLASVFRQSYDNLELIVVNDGSTDGSWSLLQSIGDPRLRVLDQANAGVCRARNQGIKAAKGELIAFLDADDTWHAECLEKLYQALCAAPSAALAYCGWQNIGLPGGQGEPYVPPDYETADKLALLFENCCWPIHACLSKKALIFEAGLFDESLVTSEDFLLWLKIGTRYPIQRVPEVLAFYHFHDGLQATRNKERAALNHWNAQRVFLDRHPLAADKLGARRIRRLMHGELLRRGFECYWKRDIRSARIIFRKVMRHGYGSIRDWKYMLPSLLPLPLHQTLLQKFSQ